MCYSISLGVEGFSLLLNTRRRLSSRGSSRGGSGVERTRTDSPTELTDADILV